MQPTIYIPNYDGSARLELLLESLAGQTHACRTVVVDNGSVDGSTTMTRTRFPRAEVLEIGRNLGFGRALNKAIALYGGDPLLLLNNDVRCDPGFVEAMLAEHRSGAEMVAGVLVHEHSPGLIDSAGIVADSRTLMAFDYLNGCPVDTAIGAPPPLAPSGGAALYDRAAFERAGGFDERIFAYYEDLDLGLRLRSSGALCALAERATARHSYSATLRHDPGAKYALTGWGRAYMLRRYGVLASLSRALRTMLCEAVICSGQVVLDRTFRGIGGRLRGWHDASGLPERQLPDGLIELPLRASLSQRLRRHPASRPS
jgi:GT2 family glycosyltransferase